MSFLTHPHCRQLSLQGRGRDCQWSAIIYSPRPQQQNPTSFLFSGKQCVPKKRRFPAFTAVRCGWVSAEVLCGLPGRHLRGSWLCSGGGAAAPASGWKTDAVTGKPASVCFCPLSDCPGHSAPSPLRAESLNSQWGIPHPWAPFTGCLVSPFIRLVQ